MSDSTIPAFMRDLNVDAVAWSEARDGDFLLLRDPASRASYDVFVIDGVVRHVDGTMQAYTKRVQGNETDFPSSFTRARCRVFNPAAWQVWRDFGITRTDETHVDLDDREGSSMHVKVIDGDVVVIIDAGYIGDRGVTLSYTIRPLHDVADLIRGLSTAMAQAASTKGADQS
jgi:hypothetical protein